jgi:hypothetical protein
MPTHLEAMAKLTGLKQLYCHNHNHNHRRGFIVNLSPLSTLTRLERLDYAPKRVALHDTPQHWQHLTYLGELRGACPFANAGLPAATCGTLIAAHLVEDASGCHAASVH